VLLRPLAHTCVALATGTPGVRRPSHTALAISETSTYVDKTFIHCTIFGHAALGVLLFFIIPFCAVKHIWPQKESKLNLCQKSVYSNKKLYKCTKQKSHAIGGNAQMILILGYCVFVYFSSK
jgi:hypothetical protein